MKTFLAFLIVLASAVSPSSFAHANSFRSGMTDFAKKARDKAAKNDPPGELAPAASALDLFPYAQAVARAKDPAARLVGGMMIETFNPAVFMAQHQIETPDAVGVNPDTANANQIGYAVILKLMDQTRRDPYVGDGLAERCGFYFGISAGLLAVVVNVDGAIMYDHLVSTAPKGSGNLQFFMGTREASNLFAAADDRFNPMRGRSHVMVWDLVYPSSGNAYWLGGILRATPIDNGDGDPHLDGDAPDYCEFADFKIDAVTGAILSHGVLHNRTSGKNDASSCD